MLVNPQDTAVLTGGLILICSIYGIMLARGTQRLQLEEEALVVGGKRLPWSEVHGVTLRRGFDSTRLQVQLAGGALKVRPKMVVDPLDVVAETIVQRAGLVPGSLETEKGERHREEVLAWLQPVDSAPVEGSIEVAKVEIEQAPATVGAKPPPQKRALGATVLFAAIFGKFAKFGLVAFNFGVKGLKLAKLGPTAFSMLATVWIYAQLWGWSFAVGFVALLLVHEIGHAIIIASKGIRTSPILFLPFVGAVIGIKDQFRDASVEAETALGGPVLGSLGACICFLVFLATESEFWLAIAYTGFLLNLFNLLPVSPLDGGRIVAAISTKLWVVGLLVVGFMAFTTGHPILILVAILGAVRAWKTWRGFHAGEPQAYFETTPSMRFAMSLAYFGLAGFLGYMMQWSLRLLEHAA